MQREIPQPGQFYRHFTNKLYQIIAVATEAETGENLVIYQALYGNFKIYARPLDAFLAPVDKETYSQATQNWQFQRVSFSNAKPTPQSSAKPIAVTSETTTPTTPSGESSSPTYFSQNHPQTSSSLRIDSTSYLKRMEQIVTAFMDASSYEEKLSILENYKDFCDNHILESMAFVLDHSLSTKTPEEKFDELKNILQTLIRFENSRLR